MQGRGYSWKLYVLVSATNLALALIFLYALAIYYAYFRMGSGGKPIMFLALIGLPLSIAAVAALTGLGLWWSRRRGDEPSRAWWQSAALVAALFGLLFVVELSRTAEARGPESGGTMTGYVRALLRQ